MTLYELVNDTEVQGAVRVSMWEGETETVLIETERTDDFGPGDLKDEWEDLNVGYLFCVDNVLHIEVSKN
jgi:hypothetical protein